MPRGGRRPGAGRKPKAAIMRIVQGSRTRAHHREADAAAIGDADRVDAPGPSSEDVLVVPAYVTDADAVAMWGELAPLAFERRTLTLGTRRALALLCEKFGMATKLGAVELGGTAHARALKQINTEMLQFGLTPCGKPLFELAPAEPVKMTGLSRFRRG